MLLGRSWSASIIGFEMALDKARAPQLRLQEHVPDLQFAAKDLQGDAAHAEPNQLGRTWCDRKSACRLQWKASHSLSRV